MVRVMLAEDMNIVRAAIIALLDLEGDIDVVADTDSGGEILRICHEHKPDVAIIDVGLPKLDGISAATALSRELPGVRPLLLTGLARPGTLRKALEAKVCGIVMKDAAPRELATAIRAVAAGRRYIDGQLALSAWESWDCPLTNRELEVLQAAADGCEAEEIASVVHLTTGTVRNYLTACVTKLSARNRIDAIRIAREVGWL
jgi:two-component system, NarL family, response regulator DesR